MLNNNRFRKNSATLMFSVIFACIVMLASAIISEFTDIPAIYVALLSVFIYLVVSFFFASYRRNNESIVSMVTLDKLFSGELGSVMLKLGSPVVLCTRNGSLIWSNEKFASLFEGRRVTKGTNIELWTGCKIDSFSDDASIEVHIGNSSFSAYSITVNIDSEEYSFVVFDDVTERDFYKNKLENNKIAVAIVMIDSFDEMSQYFQDNFTRILADIDSKVTEWADSLDGIIKSYNKDKFLIISTVENMRKNGINNNFSILDKVREQFIGDYVPLTVSIGISSIGDTISEVMKYAQFSLDTALQRGGDQAVLRHENGVDFYGGKTKSVYKRSNVKATLVARELSALISRSENVLIMGHRFGDFDSFASSVGIARYCMMFGVKPNIVVNKRDPNLARCFEKLDGIPDYDGVFIESADAMERIRSSTLLIITDVNNMGLTESVDVTNNVGDIAIIDHHIKVSEFSHEPKLTYIEPSASSASELVCEILETRTVTNKILKEEAELLLAGILLDTKQFTRNTGIRTFSAAMFLRSEGANPIEANELFKDSVDDLTAEAKFNSNIEIIQKNIYDAESGAEKPKQIAISYCEGIKDLSFRTVAAKVADKLLALRDINASFTLVKIENKVYVSSRSDGTINVQLIMERLKGGGHFDVAGAQIDGKTMAGAMVLLKDAIDDYFALLNIKNK